MLVELTCSYCGEKFNREKKDIRKSQKNYYCSRDCQDKHCSHLQSDNYTMFRHMYMKTRQRADKKYIELSITLDDIKSLWELQGGICALSGEKLVFGGTDYGKKHGENTASLDRKKSSGGYTLDNVQIVHKDINRMKFTLDQQVFINWCHKVARTWPESLDDFERPDDNIPVIDDDPSFVPF